MKALVVTSHLISYLRTWNGTGNMTELARKAGVGAHTFQRVMRGQTGCLKAKQTAALCRGLEVTEEQLLDIAAGRDARPVDPNAQVMTLTREEARLMTAYRGLPAADRRRLQEMAGDMAIEALAGRRI